MKTESKNRIVVTHVNFDQKFLACGDFDVISRPSGGFSVIETKEQKDAYKANRYKIIKLVPGVEIPPRAFVEKTIPYLAFDPITCEDYIDHAILLGIDE